MDGAVLETTSGILNPLGPSWSPPGAVFGASWAVTGLSWRPLGRSGGDPGRLLGHLDRLQAEKIRNAITFQTPTGNR
eukprot:4206320-Pyramimonas_sp.AAC.1